MRRGINLGNALEAPNEGDWGYRIADAHLDAISDAGFDGIRLPVRWDAHADNGPLYRIAPSFIARVADVVNGALSRGLKVQLDLHHYEALNAAPEAERARYLAIWSQIADHFADAPAALIFEPLNEPNGPAWGGRMLERLQADVTAIIRASNPTRLIVHGGPNWNSLDGLRGWRPPDDANVAATFHYYEPHDFTHQGAEWLAEPPRFDRAWGGRGDVAIIERHAMDAAAWTRSENVPLQLGEFGVNARVPLAQRAAWTRAVREAFTREGIAWCAWDFAGAFPVWGRDARRWIEEMRAALLD
ncbi:MAG: glycoside hydrolase family 5 protein [Caulobacterales bacterium]